MKVTFNTLNFFTNSSHIKNSHFLVNNKWTQNTICTKYRVMSKVSEYQNFKRNSTYLILLERMNRLFLEIMIEYSLNRSRMKDLRQYLMFSRWICRKLTDTCNIFICGPVEARMYNITGVHQNRLKNHALVLLPLY